MSVQTRVWHPYDSSLCLPVGVPLDTGAGGGNYTPEKFWHSIVLGEVVLASLKLSANRAGRLRASNLFNSSAPSMEILAPTVIPPGA